MTMAFLHTDIPELSGFDTGLCLSNLDVLTLRQTALHESLLAVLSELADAIIADAEEDPDTVDSILLSLQNETDEAEGAAEEFTPVSPLSRVAPINREPLARLSSRTALYTRLLLYRMIRERMEPAEEETDASLPSPLPATVRGRIAYMPGALADKAYLRLATAVKNPRAATTAGFGDACEEVQGGLCEYCLLPLENTGNGKLTAFSRLILCHRLQIVAVSDLDNGSATGQSTRIALLRASMEGMPPRPLRPVEAGEPLYLELFHATDAMSLTDLLSAAEFCGLTVTRTDTLPAAEAEETNGESLPTVACVLEASEGDIPTFLRFLSLEAPEDYVAGIYGVV